MHAFIADEEYLGAVRDAIANAQRIDVAVAFWGTGADELFAGVNVPTRILCNLLSGGTNPAPLRKLLESPHIELRHTAKLHAKVIMTDKAVIVGSANFSTNGLHYEGHELDGWREAGILTHEPNLVEQAGVWFDQQWVASEKDVITLAALDEAEQLWRSSREHRPTGPRKPFKKLRKADLLDRPIHLVLWSDDASDPATKVFNAKKEEWEQEGIRTQGLSFFEDWETLPEDAYLIDVHVGPRGGITVGPVFKRVPKLDQSVPDADTSIQIVAIVRPKPTDFPFNYDRVFKEALRERLKEEGFLGLPNDEERYRCIPLADIFVD